jgi:hypothetical protein
MTSVSIVGVTTQVEVQMGVFPVLRDHVIPQNRKNTCLRLCILVE